MGAERFQWVAEQGGEWPRFLKTSISRRAEDLAAFYSHLNGAAFAVL